jgi:hypothetical protein
MSRKPRIVAPTIAAGMIALSLERLGVLHWFPAIALFVLLMMFIVGTELRSRGKQHAGD